MDISKLGRIRDFDLDTEKVGTIKCGSLKAGMLGELEAMLKKQDVDGIDVSRKVLGLVGRIKNEDDSPDDDCETTLSDVDLQNLTKQEIENFAREFLSHNSWLLESYERGERTERKNEDGKTVVSLKPVKVEFPKKDDECDSDYLARVLQRHIDEHRLRWERMMKPLTSGLFSKNIFSNTTQDLLKEHFSISDRLGQSLRDVEVGRDIPTRLTESYIPLSPENPTHETNRRLNDVIAFADDIRPVIFQSAELFRNMTDTALQMQADFSDSAKASSTYAKIAIFIAAAGFAVTAWFSVWSYLQSSEQEFLARQQREEQMELADALIRSQDERLERLLSAFSNDQRAQVDAMIQRRDGRFEEFLRDISAENAKILERENRQLIEYIAKAIQTFPDRGAATMPWKIKDLKHDTHFYVERNKVGRLVEHQHYSDKNAPVFPAGRWRERVEKVLAGEPDDRFELLRFK